MNKNIGTVLLAIIIVNLVAWTVFLTGNNQQSSFPPNSNSQNSSPQSQGQVPSSNNQPPTNQNPSSFTTSISLTELGKHNKQSDCWVGFEGKAYDLTDWLPEHPGSASAIVPYCGKSTAFEKAFSDQHGNSQVNRLLRETTYKGALA